MLIKRFSCIFYHKMITLLVNYKWKTIVGRAALYQQPSDFSKLLIAWKPALTKSNKDEQDKQEYSSYHEYPDYPC